MSEEMQEVAQEANANDNVDLMAQIEQLKSTNERLLAESKKYKTRNSEAEELKKQLEDYKKKELEQSGNWQEMIELERKKSLELQQKIEAREQQVLKSNIFNAIANVAKDAHDVNDLLAQREYAKMLEIDEEAMAPTKESVMNFVNSLKEEKKYLFKGHNIPSMGDTKPGIEKPKQKPISKMSQAEKGDHMKALLASLGHNR